MPNQPHFEVKERKDGTWGFNLKAANGEIIATSEGYVNEAGAHRGIRAVKTAVRTILNYVIPTKVI